MIVRARGRIAVAVLLATAAQAGALEPRAYVLREGPMMKPGALHVIEGALEMMGTSRTLGPGPSDVAVHPTRPLVFVSDNLTNTVSVVDLEAGSVDPVKGTEDGKALDEPKYLAMDPRGDRVYVSNTGGPRTLSVIDVATRSLLPGPDKPIADTG